MTGIILWSNFTQKMINQLEKITLNNYMTGALNRKGIEIADKKMYVNKQSKMSCN